MGRASCAATIAPTALYRALQDGSTYCALLNNAVEQDAVDLRAVEVDVLTGPHSTGATTLDTQATAHNLELSLSAARDLHCDVGRFGSADLIDVADDPRAPLDYTHEILRRGLLDCV
eukprot:g6260.t1